MAQAETALEELEDDQIEELETDEEEVDGEEVDENLENDDNDDEDGDDGDDDDQEIVLDGDEGSHPQDEQRGIRKRINKLNAKVTEAKAGQEQSSAELEVERERNRLLQLALDQQDQPVDGPPDPNDFDDGLADAGYIKAIRDHIAKEIRAEMLQTTQETQVKQETDTALQSRQVEHYKRADTLKVKDYDDTEDKAIAILGQDVTNQLIGASDKSPEVLYYLGKNEKVAKELADLLKSNPVKGVLRIGALEAKLIARPKSKRNVAPDPDTELSGGTAGRKKTTAGPAGATYE